MPYTTEPTRRLSNPTAILRIPTLAAFLALTTDNPAYLARGDEGTVGVMDLGLNRFTIFEPSGTYVSDMTTPGGVFSPLRSFGDVLSGVSPDLMAMLAGESSYARMNRYDVNIATGEVLRDVESPPGPWDVECGDVIDGTGSPPSATCASGPTWTSTRTRNTWGR